MKYYPIFLNLNNKKCLVIGGGKVAERKILSLLDAGAKVLVISPRLTPKLNMLVKEKRIEHYPRRYEKGDLSGFLFVFSATDNKFTNKIIAEEAREERILLNVIDEPELCDFIVPSLVRRGDLLIAVSTSGKSPAMARHIRLKIGEYFGEEYGHLIEIIGAIRVKLLTKNKNSKYNKILFDRLLDSPLLQLVRGKREEDIDRLLEGILGKGFTLKELGLSIKDGN